MNVTEIPLRLTQFSHGSGCGCKIEPAILDQILKHSNDRKIFSSLIAGYETKDDAAVWDLGEENYLLSTTDFFTPIVDDPVDFGKISAANALSDIYAMGGKPAFALAILGFPVNKLPVDIAQKIISGANIICEEAGIPLAGGHSIDIPEPVFGLVVNGFVQKKFLKKNNTAMAGDILFLTKPLGTGIMSAALKRQKISKEDLTKAVSIMTRLNTIGERIAKVEGVNAMTDVTGFGLLGHLIEMCEGSGVSAKLEYKNVPLIQGLEKYTNEFIFPDNTYRNWNAYEKKVKGINGPAFITLCDPQTSGGLLFSVLPQIKDEIISIMRDEGLEDCLGPIGYMKPENDFAIEVEE
jgi:selenide, water dikinase